MLQLVECHQPMLHYSRCQEMLQQVPPRSATTTTMWNLNQIAGTKRPAVGRPFARGRNSCGAQRTQKRTKDVLKATKGCWIKTTANSQRVAWSISQAPVLARTSESAERTRACSWISRKVASRKTRDFQVAKKGRCTSTLVTIGWDLARRQRALLFAGSRLLRIAQQCGPQNRQLGRQTRMQLQAGMQQEERMGMQPCSWEEERERMQVQEERL